jgi:hypothetical protein
MSITLDNYSHIQFGCQEAAAQKFDSLFATQVSKKTSRSVKTKIKI